MNHKTETAFPVSESEWNTGLTKREYAAIHIMAAVVAANPDIKESLAAEYTVIYTDELFAKLG